jgi:predicted nucleic acid-binding protein
LRTAVDSSVLLDVFSADPTFGNASREALRRAYETGAIVACEIVWSEVRANFPQDEAFSEAMGLLGIQFDPFRREAAEHAGRLWRDYRRRGAPKKRVVPGFLIGAHALHQADALLSRDRGFYRRYFTNLSLVDPSTAAKAPGR